MAQKEEEHGDECTQHITHLFHLLYSGTILYIELRVRGELVDWLWWGSPPAGLPAHDTHQEQARHPRDDLEHFPKVVGQVNLQGIGALGPLCSLSPSCLVSFKIYKKQTRAARCCNSVICPFSNMCKQSKITSVSTRSLSYSNLGPRLTETRAARDDRREYPSSHVRVVVGVFQRLYSSATAASSTSMRTTTSK